MKRSLFCTNSPMTKFTNADNRRIERTIVGSLVFRETTVGENVDVRQSKILFSDLNSPSLSL